jgi:hypothetical protein
MHDQDHSSLIGDGHRRASPEPARRPCQQSLEPAVAGPLQVANPKVRGGATLSDGGTKRGEADHPHHLPPAHRPGWSDMQEPEAWSPRAGFPGSQRGSPCAQVGIITQDRRRGAGSRISLQDIRRYREVDVGVPTHPIAGRSSRAFRIHRNRSTRSG